MFDHQYQPLQHNDSFRVLALHPSSNDSDLITCTIRHVRLSDTSLKYEALSYTWGNGAPTKTIQLNGGMYWQLVGDSCHEALQHLRLRDKDRLIWVDAICINRQDLAERTCQVRIMDEIFRRAFNVLVYVGEHTSGSRVLFKELTAADEMLVQTGECDRAYPNEEIVQELQKFYQRPWFKRVWVLQEVCSKESVTIICGSSSVSFDALKELHFGYASNTNVTNSGAWPLPLELVHRPLGQQATPQLNLWNMLYQSRDCLATDPRDRVFALKSLIGPAQSEMGSLINYTHTIERTLLGVANFLLPVLGLRLLTAVRHPHGRNVPSWIPDWTQNIPLLFSHFMAEPTDENRSVRRAAEIKSQYIHKYELRPFQNGDGTERFELLVEGCEYARIKEPSQVFVFRDDSDTEEQIKALFSCLGYPRRTAHVDRLQHDQVMTNQLGDTIIKALSNFDGTDLYKRLNRWGLSIESDPSQAVLIPFTHLRFLSYSLNQSRISVLDNEEVAIVPACVERGDVVCIISGTYAPCVLRPDPSGTWTLVSGDCFLFSESFRDLEGSGLPYERFIRRHKKQVRQLQIR